MSREYPINCLADFLSVPREKQAECLRDFSTWLNLCRDKEELHEHLESEFPGIGAELSLDGFVWIDDGQPGISDLRFTVGGEEIGRMNEGES